MSDKPLCDRCGHPMENYEIGYAGRSLSHNHPDRCATLLKADIDSLRAQLDVVRWRSVSEPPKKEWEYLTWDDNNGCTVRYWDGDNWISKWLTAPTHWRTLPPSPTEETRAIRAIRA